VHAVSVSGGQWPEPLVPFVTFAPFCGVLEALVEPVAPEALPVTAVTLGALALVIMK